MPAAHGSGKLYIIGLPGALFVIKEADSIMIG